MNNCYWIYNINFVIQNVTDFTSNQNNPENIGQRNMQFYWWVKMCARKRETLFQIGIGVALSAIQFPCANIHLIALWTNFY